MQLLGNANAKGMMVHVKEISSRNPYEVLEYQERPMPIRYAPDDGQFQNLELPVRYSRG